MYDREIVPSDFVVPLQSDCGSYVLRMLSVDDLELDYEAVVASKDRLNGLFGSPNSWPEGLTVKDDLIDLAWHQRKFTLRHSFAYTVMSASLKLCLGCVYIFPSSAEGYDAAAFYRVRSCATAELRDAELGTRFGATVRPRNTAAAPAVRAANS